MSASVLVVHHNPHSVEELRGILTGAGLYVDFCVGLDAAFDRVDERAPELVILGWRSASATEASLPRLKSGGETRVILLAPPDELPQAIAFMEDGAEDCLTDDCGGAELLARTRAALARRPSRIEREHIVAGPIALDKAAHSVVVSGDNLRLAPTEYRLMAFFMENPGRVYSRQQLLDRVWTRNFRAGERTVDVHIRRLRQALEPFGCDDAIQTVRGFGYRFSAESPGKSAPGKQTSYSAAAPA